MNHTVYSLEEARDWFIEHNNESIICVNNGKEKECFSFEEAKKFYKQLSHIKPCKALTNDKNFKKIMTCAECDKHCHERVVLCPVIDDTVF